MRIMHVITDLSAGGAQAMLLKLLSIGNETLTPTVVSLMGEGVIGKRIAELGIPVFYLGLTRGPVDPFRALSMIRLARRIRPQLIQGWMYHGNLVASLAGLSLNGRAPVLWNIRQTVYDLSLERRMTAWVIKASALFARHPAAIIYNSRTSAEQHESLGYSITKRVMIPNGFNCEVFRPDEAAYRSLREELGIREDAILVGLIARYHPMKDHEGFLRAAGMVARRYPAVRFVLAGTGIGLDQPALLKAVADHDLNGRIFLLGERSDIPRLNAALDIACSGSAWGEGFSNSIGEAMACGVPAVVTNVGDSAHIVGETGLVVPPRDPESIAEAIGRLLDADPDERKKIGGAARQRIENKFSLAAVSEQYDDLYFTYAAER